jgi:hypothetical protein
MITWKNIENRRHAVVSGNSVCGIRGLEHGGECLPCETCLNAVMKAAKEAFPE